MNEAWMTFLGRLHPLILHLPIGIFVGLLGLELWGKLNSAASLRVGQRRFLTFLLGATATLAAISGWQLGAENGYSSGDFVWHRAAGISFASSSVMLMLSALATWRGMYRFAMFVAVVSVVPAGHFGASMTHGKGFLTEPFEETVESVPTEAEVIAPETTPERVPEAALEEPIVTWYDARIAPIIEAYCIKCHGEDKQKGDLALHTGQLLVEGNEFGLVVVPGDPDESSLLQRVLTPPDDDDHMPPASKPQPSAAEVAELQRWIEAGASLDAPAPEGVAIAVSVATPTEPAAPERAEAEAPPEDAMVALRESQIHAEIVDPVEQLIWIDFRPRPETDDATVAKALATLGAFTCELSLAGTAISDYTLSAVCQLPRLDTLDLSRTDCSASGVAKLAELETLRVLNLTGTSVGDEVIDALLGMNALERVSLWQSGVSPEGLARLREARPALRVEGGDRGTLEAEEVEPVVSFSKHPELDAVNSVCPVTGSPVDSRYRVVHEDRVVGFCCPNCPGTFLKAPGDYTVED